VCRPTDVGDGCLAEPVRGRVGTRGGRCLVGYRRRLAGQEPGGAAAIPPTDRTATSAAAAALIVNSLLGTAVLRGTRVGGVDRSTAANSAIASRSPASSSGAAGGGGRGQQPDQPTVAGRD
jgi:hypothetical protein